MFASTPLTDFMLTYSRVFRALLLLLVLVSGCTSVPVPETPPSQYPAAGIASTPATIPTHELYTPAPEAVPSQESGFVIAVTHQRLDGNRLVSGSGAMPAEPFDIPLSGKPIWVVAAPIQAGSIWVVALEDGQVQALQIEGGEVSELKLNVSRLPAGMPPVLEVVGNRVYLLSSQPDASDSTNPIRLEDGTLAFIDIRGQLRLIRQGDTHTLAVNALPDARILSDDEGRLLFLSAPTEGYPHGVLGDPLEARTITLVDTTMDPFIVRVIQIDPGDVIEGIAPIWVDLDGDGEREIIVTQSSAGSSSRIVAYREDGSLFASGEPIGQGFRWRHQLAVGQFIEGGSQEIAVIRTPHIGGVIEIFALEEDRLVIQAELNGYSSHQIGSRNLDSALAADFNGDGRIEIVVPDQSQTTLAGIQSPGDGLAIVWEAPIGVRLSTNVAAVILPDGRLALGVGHEGGILRIWYPEE
jgi:hypothetical protein